MIDSNNFTHGNESYPDNSGYIFYHHISGYTIAYDITRVLQAILSVLGNTLTVVAVLWVPAMKTSTNVFVASLASADLLSGALTPLGLAVDRMGKVYNWRYICLCSEISLLNFAVINGMSVFCITSDRFLSVMFPLRYKQIMTVTRAKMATINVWVVTSVFTVTLGILGNQVKEPEDCSMAFFFSDTAFFGMLLPFFFVFIGTTIIMFFVIMWKVHKQHQTRVQVAGNHGNVQAHTATREPVRRNRNVMKVLSIVLVIYVCLYFPFVALMSVTTRSSPAWLQNVYWCTMLLYYANMWSNPMLYAWKVPEYRTAFKKLLKMKVNDADNPNSQTKTSTQN